MKHLDAIAKITIRSAAPWLPCLVALQLIALPAFAWTQYSVDGDSGNCADCHGNFTDVPYTSLVDGQTWPNSLHEVHRADMLDRDCDTCHTGGGSFPVNTASSAGGDGLSPISCVGCHGRSQDGSGGGTSGYAAGLRQHHTWAGESCLPCHADSQPANFTPAAEGTPPPYYANPGAGHPAMPDDACNPAPGYPEDFAGSTIGLDNDGDGLYDQMDADCAASSTCGDGNLDPGEDCDDGNNDDGDCCAADCSFEAVDSACDNGLFCTVNDACDGSGTCLDGPARDCDDGDVCTDDSCNETAQRCDNIFNSNNGPSCQPVCTDVDGDGYSPETAGCGPVDCNDDDAAINPGATEVCDDNRDNDCNGLIDSADPNCEWTGIPAVWDGPLVDPTYAGSEACGECHEVQFETWQDTLHARMLVRPGDAQAAGFDLPLGYDGNTIETWDDVRFVVGQKWRSHYVDADGRLERFNWNYDGATWQGVVTGEQDDYDCGACHTTGYDPDATFEEPPGTAVPGIVGSWVEYNIGCEACHGPGAEHADSPSADNINRIRFDWYDPDNDGTPDPVAIASAVVCGNCHYRNDHTTIQTDRLNREQYNDWLVSAHGNSLPLNAISTYCAKCHSPGNAVADAAEHNFTYFPPTDATHVACVSCHDPHRISNERWATLAWPAGGQQDPKNLPASIARYRGTDFNNRTSDYEAFDNAASNDLCSDCHTMQPGFRRHIDASPDDVIDLMPPGNFGDPFLLPHAAHYENGDADCVDCHMHYSRESANPGDIRSHSLIPDEASTIGGRLPHYSWTCGQCHSEAPDCEWCHAQFGRGQYRGQFDTSPGEGPRTRRVRRGLAFRD